MSRLRCFLIGNQTGSVVATRVGGWFVFAFVAFVIYFYVAALWEETRGRALPLGRPLVS
jgi:succinate-acetate transporter protein